MRLLNNEIRDDFYGDNRLESISIILVCKNDKEFEAAFEKIKHIEGIYWDTCQETVGKDYYGGVWSMEKTRHVTLTEMVEERKYVRDQISEILKLGKYRNK